MELNQELSIWIDHNRKIISFKELPNAQHLHLSMQKILELVSQSYKIG